MIKKTLLIIVIMAGFAVPALAMSPAHAVDILNGSGSAGPCNNTNAASKPEICNDDRSNSAVSPIIGPNGILTSAINILSIVIGITSVIIIVVEGLRMILANGDAGTASNARRGIIYACAGLLIALVSQGMVALVLNKL
jgi:hypothetical protein